MSCTDDTIFELLYACQQQVFPVPGRATAFATLLAAAGYSLRDFVREMLRRGLSEHNVGIVLRLCSLDVGVLPSEVRQNLEKTDPASASRCELMLLCISDPDAVAREICRTAQADSGRFGQIASVTFFLPEMLAHRTLAAHAAAFEDWDIPIPHRWWAMEGVPISAASREKWSPASLLIPQRIGDPVYTPILRRIIAELGWGWVLERVQIIDSEALGRLRRFAKGEAGVTGDVLAELMARDGDPDVYLVARLHYQQERQQEALIKILGCAVSNGIIAPRTQHEEVVRWGLQLLAETGADQPRKRRLRVLCHAMVTLHGGLAAAVALQDLRRNTAG